MDKYIIQGGVPLNGKVVVSGFKNATLALISSTFLANDRCVIENVPLIEDVFTLVKIMESLGAEVELKSNGKLIIDTSTVKECVCKNDLAKNLRASYYLIGAGLGRFGHAEVTYPGGCNIGTRPIDQHIKGFEALGSKVDIDHGIIKVSADKLTGTNIFLDVVSVGATINIMLASVLAEGKTVIENAAKEPHIVDTANCLSAMGANIRGAGTDVIRIQGVEKLHGCTYAAIPDQIEAGTYMIAAAATHGDVTIHNVIPKHLEPVSAKLREMGIGIEEGEESVRVFDNQKRFKSVDVKTMPYPGFPTDLQQPMSVLLSVSNGTGIVTESIFDGRFKYVDELKRMGANIKVNDRTSVINGVDILSGAKITATDLRAGAACIVAGLIAEGQTEIDNIYHIDRGYERLEDKLIGLGARIKRISE
jgi:UDP-N-acetylglucosamine 1-carboxyvinyltransferase